MFPQLGSAPPEWAGDWEPSPETSPSYGASRAPGMRAAKADTEDTSMGPYGTSVGHGGRGAASDARGGALGALGRGGGAQAPVYTHWLNRGQGDNAAAGGSPARGGGLVQSVASVGDTDHDDVVTSRPQTQPSSRSNSRRNSLQRADTRPYNGGLPMPGQTDAAPGARGGGRPPLGSGRGRAADAPQSPQHDAIPVGAAQPPPAPAALARQSSSDNNNALSEQGLAGGGLGSSWGHDGDMDASRATGVGTGSIADPTAVRGRAPAAHQGPRRVLRVGRFDSWARMVAYEACWQVCLQSALSGERLAEPFLDRGCLLLKKAFGIEALVLGNPNQDRPEVIWEDVDTVQEALGTDEDYQRYTERVREGLRVEVLKIQRRQARGGGGDAGDPFVVLRPRSRPEDAAVVVRPGGSGGGGSSSVLVSQAEAAEDMLLELWDGAGCLARGAVPMGALWASLEGVEEVLAEVGGGAPGAAGAGGKEGGHCGAGAGGLGNALRHKAARLVRRAAGRKDPVVLGALRDGDGGARHKVHLLGESGVAVGKVTLALWRPTRAEADMANGRQAGRMCELGDGVGVGGGGNGGRADGGGAASALQRSWSLNNQQAYDMALMAALAAQGCGARKLVLEGPWQWLLKELARVYGVREAYTALTYLKWALQPQHATPTADCFSVLLAGVRPLKEAELARTLPAEESAMLRSICQAVESLVARALESYRMLSEQAPSGLCGPGEAPPQLPAPAMAPALALYSMLRDPLSPSDQQWLSARFQTAARRRYLKLELVCAEAPDSVAPAPHAPGGAQGGGAARAAAATAAAPPRWARAAPTTPAAGSPVRSASTARSRRCATPSASTWRATCASRARGSFRRSSTSRASSPRSTARSWSSSSRPC
ncbi:unnamed protein product [Pedinophyceae sp. YPF-701]|nr:unnamed protein product [Pedinophyceae sp. YPF-701]